MNYALKQFEHNSRKLRYIDTGSGPPVVFLHGAENPDGQWDAQIPVLQRAGYRVVYPHLDDSASLAGDAAAILHLLDHLAVDSAVFVGHSRGGTLVREILLTRPQIIKAIVSVDSYTFGKLNTKPLGVQRFDAETRRLYEMNKDKLAALGRPWDYPGSFNVRRLTDLKAWQSQRDQFPGGVSDLFDVSKPIEACDAPLLVFTAGRGKIRSDDQEAVALRTRLADQGARLVVLHHSGHWIHREQPEIFDQELLKFLQGFDVP